jgi:uncharacterized protein YPO0396
VRVARTGKAEGVMAKQAASNEHGDEIGWDEIDWPALDAANAEVAARFEKADAIADVLDGLGATEDDLPASG